ncbi:MAG: hypothetical protein VW397_03425 [Candidatus Margulisiibacteriota bacterium]
MSSRYCLFYVSILVFSLVFSITSYSAPVYQLEDSAPPMVELSGVLEPSNNSLINGVFKTKISIYNSDQSIPTASFTKSISVLNNYFRTEVDLKKILVPFFNAGKPVRVRMDFSNDLHTELPIASIPTVIKSSSALKSTQMMDSSVVFFDYNNLRMGIGTTNPVATLEVVGTMNVSKYLYGDGSKLTNLTYKGEDNYNWLRSKNGEFLVVTINVDGDMMIGGRQQQDSIYTDLTVYGSLLVEPSLVVTSSIISGAGSRWMWYAERDILRIGYVPSYYWDNQFSGKNSIVFGYSSMATGNYSIVTGGYYNEARSNNSIIAGGSKNRVLGESSIIVGGQNNLIDSELSVILGGMQNIAKYSSIVLGGYENRSFGEQAIVSGYKNNSSGDNSIILGGKNNELFSDGSLAMGQNIYIFPSHNNTVVFGFNDSRSRSLSTRNIYVNVKNGMGIGTVNTSPNAIHVEGIVSANFLIGDGSNITNIKNADSAWAVLDPSKPTFLVHQGRMGVLTGNLIESLNVEGSINISGNAVGDEGTIQYLNDSFSVFKGGQWVSLQMTDTDTTYNASAGLSLHPSSNMFDLVTANAKIGQVLIWNGKNWAPAYLDQFIEQAESTRINQLDTPKRLYLSTGNVVINKPSSLASKDLPDVPLSVFNSTDQDTSLYLFDESNDGHHMSLSINPPGMHFESHYNLGSLIQSPRRGGGFEVTQNAFVMYIDDDTGIKTNLVLMDQSAVRINDNSTIRKFPFFVGGTLASDSFYLFSDPTAVGIYLVDDYFRNCSAPGTTASPCYGTQARERSLVFEQVAQGGINIQSGPMMGDVIFSQKGQQIAKLQLNKIGKTSFGITPKWLRAELDVYGGDVHVSDGYGVHFYDYKSHKSKIVFDSTQNNRIQFFSSNEFNVPNLTVSSTGNVALNSVANDYYDLFVTTTENLRDISVQLNAKDNLNSGIRFLVDKNSDDDIDDSGEEFRIHLNDEQMIINDSDSDPLITISQNGNVGLNNSTPTVSLAVSGDMVLLNQSGLYFNEVGNTAVYPAIEVSSNSALIESSDHITFLNPSGNVAMDVNSHGVAIHALKSKNTISSVPIGLEINGNMVVSGDIYNKLNDKIFPFDVQNSSKTKSGRLIDTIEIDTASGLSLSGVNTPQSELKVVGKPYYNRIKLPSGEIFSATGNNDLRLIGKGITITANNQQDRALVSSETYDNLKLLNDLVSGGEIAGSLTVNGDFIILGNKLKGNAAGIYKIPYRWERVTRNNLEIIDPLFMPHGYYDDGEIYYTKGNVGINTDSPKTLFETVGTASVNELIISNMLQTSLITSTQNFDLFSNNSIAFQSESDDVLIARNGNLLSSNSLDELLRITKKSQLLFDVADSNYLIDLGKNNPNNITEFLIETPLNAFIDFKRSSSTSFLTFRYDTLGSSYNETFLTNPNIQLEAPNGFGFYTNSGKSTLQLSDNGKVGIFQATPVNNLDINGNLSIGYTTQAPLNSLIVERNLAVGLGALTLPRSKMEVSGSVIVGEPSSIVVPKGLYIKGQGTSKLFIGGLAKDDEQVFVNGDMSLKNGLVTIRNGNDSGLVIQRDNSSNRVDTISQVESGRGLRILSLNDIRLKTYDGTSNWNDELVLTTSGILGIGGAPSSVFHIMDDDSDTIVKIKSASDANIRMKNGSIQGVIGANSEGLKIKTNSSSMASAELTIEDDKVGINANPIDNYDMHIKGNLNATNFIIKDQYEVSRYRNFQTVPTGVIILWIGDLSTIPTGWQLCNGNNGCPDMTGKFVKGVTADYSNINQTAGSHDGILSQTTHSHSSASHHHKLTSDGHAHSFSLNSKKVGNLTTGSSDGYTYYGKSNGSTYTGIMAGKGSHFHTYENTHNHTGSNSFTGGTHADIHDKSGSESHSHGGANSSQSTNKTNGTGSGARGTDGDAHVHTFDNRPEAKAVYFIVKVAES